MYNKKFRFFKRTRALESRNSWKTGRKEKLDDFYGVLEAVAWLWRLLGLFCLTIKHRSGVKKYELCKFYATWNFLVFAACASGFVYMSMAFNPGWSLKLVHYPLNILTMYMRVTTALICIFFTNVVRVFYTNELCTAINKLSQEDYILEKMSNRFDYDYNGKLMQIYVLLTFSIIAFFIGYDFYITYLYIDGITLPWLLLMFPFLTQVMNFTIFVSLVGWIGLKFHSINEKIGNVMKRINAPSPKVLESSDICAENLRVLSKAHYNICGIGKRINRIFNIDLVISVTTAFIILSTTLYYILYEIQRKKWTNYVQIFSYVHCELIHSIPIIVLVIICNWTTNQAVRTGKLIHEVRVEKIDSHLHDAVKSFSLQLHHQKLEFTGGGFFPLSSVLLQTMVGTITTYLVILIQFRPSLT